VIDEPSILEHPFWSFSLSIYSKEGVPAELIELQDTFDIDVNVALFCVWLGYSIGLQLSEDQLSSTLARCSPWNTKTVIPMRSIRRYLKNGTAVQPIAQHAAALRTQIKRLELMAEQIEQAFLYDWFVEQHIATSEGSREIAEENLTLFMCRSDPEWVLQKTQEAFKTTLRAAEDLDDK